MMFMGVDVNTWIALGSVLFGAALMAGGVLLGGLMVFRTKREPHESFLAGPAPADGYVDDPDALFSEDADLFHGKGNPASEAAALRATAETFGDLDRIDEGAR